MKQLWQWIRELIPVVGIALIAALLINTYAAQEVEVPTGSMLPTIQLNDRLIIEKSLLLQDRLSFGDIVVFYPPIPNNGSPKVANSAVLTGICGALNVFQGCPELYVKRLIGLPADTIEVKDGTLYRNGSKVDEPYISDKMDYSFGPVTVPAEHYFFLGDNRNTSFDSHMWATTPFVDKKEIVGKVIFRLFPLRHTGTVSDVLRFGGPGSYIPSFLHGSLSKKDYNTRECHLLVLSGILDSLFYFQGGLPCRS